MAGGALDSIVARIEAYMGEFLQSRQGLLDAKQKIESALAQAQGSGSAKIGEKTFSYADLSRLATDNDTLLARNAELQTQIAEFKDKYDQLKAGAGDVMDTLVTDVDPDYPWYDTPGLMGMGAVPVLAMPE